jgi:hypothetical protein
LQAAFLDERSTAQTNWLLSANVVWKKTRWALFVRQKNRQFESSNNDALTNMRHALRRGPQREVWISALQTNRALSHPPF